MSGSFYIDVLIIVIIQSLLLFFYKIFNDKINKKNDPLADKLKVLEAILQSTKHDKIVQLDKVQDLELECEEVFVFSKDLYRDVTNKGQFAQELYNVGTFYNTVKENLTNNRVHYTYYLKEDSHWKHFLYSFLDSYSMVENLNKKVSFYIIPSSKYFFYDEIYLYKMADNEYQAFEFLPSISDEKEQILFFLKLDSAQVNRLVAIKEKLSLSYTKKAPSQLVKVDI